MSSTKVLTGESPSPQRTPRREPSERSPVRALIESKARLAYTLVKRRYDVNATDLINMAPFFFTLLAEGSLAWRRERLRVAEDAMSRFGEIVDGADHLACMRAAFLTRDGLESERESIEALDIFGEKIPDETRGWGYDSSFHKPFADSLRKQAGDLRNPSVVSVDHDHHLGFGLSIASRAGRRPSPARRGGGPALVELQPRSRSTSSG